MNERPVVASRGSWAAAIALVALVAAAAVLLIAYASQRGRVQRETQRQVDLATRTAAELQRTPAAVSPWQLAQRIETGLTNPVALAWTPEAVYVAGDEVARTFDHDGRPGTHVALPGHPTAMSGDGKRLIVGFRRSMFVYDRAGTLVSEGPSYEERAWVTSVLPLGDEVWVADSGNRVIHRCRPDGSLIADLGRTDPATGYPGLLVPSPHLDLALTPDGEVLVNNPGKQRVEVWDRKGKLLRTFGKASNDLEGFCGCCNPIAIAALPDGRVVTAEKGIVRVKVYRADGTFESLVATTPTLSRGVDSLDVATTVKGEVLVLDPRARAILVFRETARQ